MSLSNSELKKNILSFKTPEKHRRENVVIA